MPARLKIISHVEGGMERPHLVEPDRARAIETAIAQAAAADVILIAGKGHENYQEIGGKRLPFSDQAVARAALARRASP